MRARRRATAAAAVVVALGGCTGSYQPRPAGALDPLSSPSASSTRNTGLDSSESESEPEVSCAKPLRLVNVIAGVRPEPPYATTSEEALQRVLDSLADGDVPDRPLYVRENFERIVLARNYEKASQRAKRDRFAGYRPDASIFVIIEFERFGPEDSWLQGEISFCLSRAALEFELTCYGSDRAITLKSKRRANNPPILTAEASLEDSLERRWRRFADEPEQYARENFELIPSQSSRNRAVFAAYREDDSVFLRLTFTRAPQTGDWGQSGAEYCEKQ